MRFEAEGGGRGSGDLPRNCGFTGAEIVHPRTPVCRNLRTGVRGCRICLACTRFHAARFSRARNWPQLVSVGWVGGQLRETARGPGRATRQGLDLYDGLDSRPSYRFRQGLDLYDGVILRLGEGRCEVMTDPGGIRAEKRGLALLVICIPTRKQ